MNKFTWSKTFLFIHFCVILCQSSLHSFQVSSKDLRKAENTTNFEPFSSNNVQGISHKRKEHTKSLSLNRFWLQARRSKAASNVNRQWGEGPCSLLIAQCWTWKESGWHLSKHPDNVWHCFLFYAFVKTPTRHFLFCACISLSNFLVFLLLLLWKEKLKVKCSHPGLQLWL